MTDATGTVRFHRVLRAPPERVYRAFLEPNALAKWLPPHGFVCAVERLDARVGGSFRMTFVNFGAGVGHSGVTGGWGSAPLALTATPERHQDDEGEDEGERPPHGAEATASSGRRPAPCAARG